MSKLQKFFGRPDCESSMEEPAEILRYARRVGARVWRVCQKTTWDSKCLVQALTAQRILAGKNIHSTLYMGLREENGSLFAHAWLRCGNLYVTGGYNKEHTVVSVFYR